MAIGIFPYMGGDSENLKHVARLIPCGGEVLFDGFCGSATVSIHFASRGCFKRVVCNDLDRYIFYSYQIVKGYPELFDPIASAVRDLCELYWRDRGGMKSLLREMVDDLRMGRVQDPIEAGFLTIVLHNVCHNPYSSGLPVIVSRFNDCGYGYRIVMNRLSRVHEAFRNIEPMSRDALESIGEFDCDGCVMYLDPPHIIPERSDYGYYRLNFTPADAVRLARVLSRVSRARVVLKLTEGDMSIYPRILGGWRIVRASGRTEVYIRRPKRFNIYYMVNFEASSILRYAGANHY